MSDRPAVIAGSLVDAKNVNTHKVFRLVIDVPAEHAVRVIEAFGWPTMAAPVPVAIARLSKDASGEGALAFAAGDPDAPFGKAASTEEDSHVNRSASAQPLQLMSQRGEVEALSKGAAEPQACEASPAPTRRPVPLAGRVKLACDRADFYDWLRREPAYDGAVIQAMNDLAPHGGDVAFQAISEAVVKRLCGVERKRDIVPGSRAGETWRDLWFQFTHSDHGRAA